MSIHSLIRIGHWGAKHYTGLLLTAAAGLLMPLLLIAPLDAGPGAPVSPSVANVAVFQKGEELTYEVSYLSMKIGKIVTRVLAVERNGSSVRIRTECLMRSYKGVPFVTLNTIFQSTINERLYSVSFGTKEHIEDTLHKYINYTYPAGGRVVYISERVGNDPCPWNYDTLRLDGKRWQDGLSLLFYARAHAHERFTDRVPVLIYRTKAITTIRFGAAEEAVEIDAVNYPIPSYKLDGVTGFTGVFGLTGGFEGWFSRDAAAVPLVAKMHVIIGSIRLQLISWKRSGWTPPKTFQRN
jgi:hypothetical protein